MNTAINSANAILSENLSMWRLEYATKEDFINVANEICNQFPDEPSSLTKEENEAIAAKIWDSAN